MRLYVVQGAGTGDLDALGGTAGDGRAAAMSRRRALAAGKTALAPARECGRTWFPELQPRDPAAGAEATRPAPGAAGPVAETEVAIDGVAPARLGRTLSMQRRRQISQGKQALGGCEDRTGAARAKAPAFTVYRGGAR